MGSFSCDAVDYICSLLMVVRGAPSGILGRGVSVTVWLVVGGVSLAISLPDGLLAC